MEPPRFAPRIHVLLACEAPVGLVLRRGPSKCVASILWDRRTDEFRLGQWLKGRIYERRSDISPDGKFALYFAMNGKWKSETKGSWTAISRVPYLKAIALFAKGDCWHGGGLWTGQNSYWLNDGYGHVKLRDSTSVRRDLNAQPEVNYGGECPGVHSHRLPRDGWNLAGSGSVGKWHEQDIFEKPIGRGWTLRRISHAQVGAPPGKGCYWDEHELVGPNAAPVISCPEWEWADLDGNRIVWAAGGKLFAAKEQKVGLADETVLHDFNAMTFEAIEAPY